MIIKAIFLIALLPIFAKCTNEDFQDDPEDCEKDFRCIIKYMEFQIPDQEMQINNMKIKLTDLIIYGFDIEHIKFSYFPEEEKVSNSIIVKVQINNGHANGTINIPNLVKIKAHATITNLTIELPLEFIKGDDGLIENVTIIEDSFYSQLDNFTISVSGLLTSLIRPIIPSIEKAGLDFVNNETVLYSILNPLIEEYGGKLFAQINTYIRSEINDPEDINIPISNINKLIPLIKSPVIDLLRYFLNDLVGDASNPLNFNNLINRFMGESALLKLTTIGQKFGFNVPIVISALIPESQTTIDFIIKEISIDGINTWKDLSFLTPDPSSQFILDSHANLGNLQINVSTVINFTAVDFNTSDVSIYSQDFDLYLELVDNTIDIDIQIAAVKGASSNFTNAQYRNFDCLSKLIDNKETGVTKLLLNTTFKRFDYDTKGVLDGFIFNTVSFILNFFIQNNLELVPKFLNGFIYEFLLSTVVKNEVSNKTCPMVQDPPIKEIDIPITAGCFGGAVFISIIFAIVVVVLTKQINEKQEKLADVDNVEERSFSGCQLFFRTDEKASLMMHPAIPLWARLLVPLMLFANIALFISSNSGLGAAVFLKLLFGKSPKVSLPSMFNFGLINSITEMWQAKSYFLSILIGVLSCLWPYTKLVMMVIIWMLPSTVLKVHIRSRILRVLDELGKWSLLDSYVMTLMLIAFHIKLDFPIVNTKDIHYPTFIAIWVYPGYGFITLILGTLMSLAASHIICIMNRMAKKYNKEEKVSTTKKAVYKTQHWALNLLIVIFLLIGLSFFTYGMLAKSSSFDFAGLAGWLIDILDKPTKKAYSIIDLGLGIPDAAEFPNSFGVRITQFIFFIVTVVVPYIHMIFMFFLLFVPMTKKVLLKFYYFCETLYAWSCLDVFIISILATVLEIGQLTSFLVADKCDFIQPIIEDYFSDEYLVKGHEKCFVVITRVLPGAYYLIVATLFHTMATIWINIKTRKLSKDEESTHEVMNEGETNFNDDQDIEEMEDIESHSPYVSNTDLKGQQKLTHKNSLMNSLKGNSIIDEITNESSTNITSDKENPSKPNTKDEESAYISDSISRINESSEKT